MRSRTRSFAVFTLLVSCASEPSDGEVAAQSSATGSTSEGTPSVDSSGLAGAPSETSPGSGGATNPPTTEPPSGGGATATGAPSNTGAAPEPGGGAPSGGSPNTPSEPVSPSGGGGGSAVVPVAPNDAGISNPTDASVDPEVPVDVDCEPGEPVAVGPLGLELVVTSNELDLLSYAVQPPMSEDWFLVQQNGRIRVLKDGALLPDVFYDVSSEMNIDPSYDERGLHAIAFPPDYASSGLFYVALTPTTGDRANRDLVLEHSVSESDAYAAEMTPTKELLATEGISPNSLFVNIHNNYLLAFGPDGKLYVGTGDGGGSCNDNAGFEDTPQQLNSTFGKILRLDPSAEAPYAADGNPFAATGDARIFHYGLRNPFRFSWDSLTGDLYIGDVGQDTHEEINFAPSGSMGLNFGWAAWEGDEQVCQNRPLNEGSEITPPIFFTDHGGGGQFGAGCNTSPFCDYGAIVGGVVYRGSALGDLFGAYIFGDWVSDNMAVIRQCEGVTSPVTSIDYVRDPNLPDNGYFVKVGEGVPDVSSITAVIQGNDNELYIVANRNALLRVVPAP